MAFRAEPPVTGCVSADDRAMISLSARNHARRSRQVDRRLVLRRSGTSCLRPDFRIHRPQFETAALEQRLQFLPLPELPLTSAVACVLAPTGREIDTLLRKT